MEELQQLSDAIKQYEDGDLLAVAEIRETAETLQNSIEDEQITQILADIVKTSEEIVLQGSSEENLQQLQELGSALVTSASSAEEVVAEEVQEAVEDAAEEQIKTPAAADLDEVVIEDSEILSSFLVETHDHLDDIEERILDLEKSYDEQTVHDIFRSMHTIKGVSSFIGLSKIKGFSHRLETVLNAMRTGDLETEDEIVDILLNGGDVLQQMVSDIEQQAQDLDTTSGDAVIYEGRIDTSEIDERLEPYLKKIESDEAGGNEAKGETTTAEASTAGTSSAEKGEVPKPAEEKSLTEELISPEMVQKFVEETSDLVDTAENSMLQLEKDPTHTGSIEEAFRAIHTVKGNAGFFGFAMLEKMCMGIEGILDTLRTGARKPDAQIVNLLLQSIDGLNATLQKVHSGEILPGELSESSVSAEKAVASKEEGDYKPLGDMLVDMGIASQEAVDQALDMQRMRLGEILIDQGGAKQDEIEKALEEQGKEAPEK